MDVVGNLSGSCARYQEVNTARNPFLSSDLPVHPCHSSSLDTQGLRELRNKCLTSSLSSLPAWMGNLGHPGGLNAFWITRVSPLFCLTSAEVSPAEPQEGIIFADHTFGPILLSTHDPRFARLSFSIQPLGAVGLDMGSTPWTR